MFQMDAFKAKPERALLGSRSMVILMVLEAAMTSLLAIGTLIFVGYLLISIMGVSLLAIPTILMAGILCFCPEVTPPLLIFFIVIHLVFWLMIPSKSTKP